ncbi:MAG: 4-amino-4-deoxy-L-arabinose transferase [Gammaproteobacteria bacterium]|jgi:multidrug transporter EmrE-like cation transporter|nr:4-amino-4-deoxy-L-arabinose transferase [Gammaproteobacteria bacterium]
MTLTIFPWLLLGVLLNASAQLLLKAGAERISHISFSWDNLVPMALQVGTNPSIILGLITYLLSVIMWIGVLSRVDVSVAYPMVSLGYVVNAIAAYYLFSEPMNAMRISGIFVILIGVYMVARS